MKPTRWTGRAHTLSWFTPGNWTAGVPLAQQVTQFTDGKAWRISLAGPGTAQAGSMTVLGDALTFSGGTLALNAAPPKSGNPTDLTIGRGGSVTVAADATIDAQNTVEVGSVVQGSLTAGTIAVAGTLDASILDVRDGQASIAGNGAHVALLTGGYFALVAGGTLAISAGGTLDAGPGSLDNQYSSLAIGNAQQDGLVTLSGPGSLIELSGVTVGDDSTGSLAIQGGATAMVNYLDSGSYGVTDISVSGSGSALDVTRGIELGNDTSLSGLTLSVTDDGSVNIGSYGLALYYGAVVLDASATLDRPGHQPGRADRGGGAGRGRSGDRHPGPGDHAGGQQRRPGAV